MQTVLLHVDRAFDDQARFLQECAAAEASSVRDIDAGSLLRLWGSTQQIDEVGRALVGSLPASTGPRLTFLGSGDFHHLTALLIRSALTNFAGDITVIHVDNHPDWVRFPKGIHCGSWVTSALQHPQVRKVITLGVCSEDLENPEPKLAALEHLADGTLELYPYCADPSAVAGQYGEGASYAQVDGHLRWRTIGSIGEREFLDHLKTRIETDTIYITIDKDVLASEFAVTNWDQGCMSRSYLLELLSGLLSTYNLLGADVIGDYSPASFSGPLRNRLSKYYERFKDQSQYRGHEQAASINDATNRLLLRAFQEARP